MATAQIDQTPRFVDRPSPGCPICATSSTRTIRFPANSEAYSGCLPWPENDKFYCRECQYIWHDGFSSMGLSEYGSEYVKCNTAEQRRPNARMAASPWMLERVLSWTGGRRFLDYGIGYNTTYVEPVRALGIDLWGCDISETVPYDKHVVRLPDNEAVLFESPFDGIISQDCLEHFNEPFVDWQRLHDLIRPGGIILAGTPVLEWLWTGQTPIAEHIYLQTPWHCALMSSRAMNLIAKRVGLELIGPARVATSTGAAFILRRPSGNAGTLEDCGETEIVSLRRRLIQYHQLLVNQQVA